MRTPVINSEGLGKLRAGFTFVELLVIIGIVAVLTTIRFSAVAGAKSHTKVAMCTSNARQIALALHLYANDNGNKLPSVAMGSAAWAWDIPTPASYQMLLSAGKQKRTFYCPGTAPRFTDFENFADPASISNPTRTLWSFGMPSGWGGNDAAFGFHILGYIPALDNGAFISSNRNWTIFAEPVKTGTLTLRPPPNAERVLLADATISAEAPQPGNYSGTTKRTYNYADVAGGFYKHFTSPHMKRTVPAGGNVAFKDGHVAWRKFEDMDQRATGPGFWW